MCIRDRYHIAHRRDMNHHMKAPLSDAPGARPRTALLLAAGMGSRLSPLTDSTAKCLIPVSGIPILERLIRTLISYGFTRLVIVVGHEAHSIRDYLGDHSNDIEIDYVVSSRYRTTNNIYSLWLARRVINEPFLLIESDLVFDASLLEEMPVSYTHLTLPTIYSV